MMDDAPSPAKPYPMHEYDPGFYLNTNLKTISKAITKGLGDFKISDYQMEEKAEEQPTIIYMGDADFEQFYRSERKFLVRDPNEVDGHAKGERLHISTVNGEKFVLVEAVGGTQIIRPRKLPSTILNSCGIGDRECGLMGKPYVGLTKIREVTP